MGGGLPTRLTLLLVVIIGCEGQPGQVRMTLLDHGHFASERTGAGGNHLQCYLSRPDKAATVASLRISNTGNDSSNPSPETAVYDPSRTYPIWRVDLKRSDNGAFGVFGCNATISGKPATLVPTVRMRSDAEIVPSSGLFSQTVNVGDTGINITVESSSEEMLDFVWRRDEEILSGVRGKSVYAIKHSIGLGDAGVYETHVHDRRDLAKHALQLLIVRACPAYRWGPPSCLRVCDNCYNGGVCDENSGECTCPAGFNGTNCENACGAANNFGDDCLYHCSSTLSSISACKFLLFCRPHPAGCRCITGYRGLRCDKQCSNGTFGASCLQTCHCAPGVLCNIFSGICDGECAAGWTGSNCQVPEVCPNQYYGTGCTSKCHCSSDQSCNKTTGKCPGRKCAPGYRSYGDNPMCTECVGATYGLDCAGRCHCSEDSCNRISGACSGQCEPQWVDLFPPHNCETGLVNVTYTKRNPGVAVPVRCLALQGPGGYLDTLNFDLSRQANVLDRTNISDSISDMSDGETIIREFPVNGAYDGEELYCQLWRNGSLMAVLSTNISIYELPELTSAPTEIISTDSTVSIRWKAWNESTDDGDPPVIGYLPYYKKATESQWTAGSDKHMSYQEFTFTELTPDTNYSFSVAAVRDGEGGEGPRSESLHLLTYCDGRVVAPTDVAAFFTGEYRVNVTWKLTSDDLACSTGVDHFTIYYSGTRTDEAAVVVDDPDARWHVVDGLLPGISYAFKVTLTTSGGESGVRESSRSLTIPGTGAGIYSWFAVVPICLIVVIAVILLYKKRKFREESASTKPTAPTAGAPNNAYAGDSPGSESLASSADPVFEVVKMPVPILITELESYIEKCETGENSVFEAQFQVIVCMDDSSDKESSPWQGFGKCVDLGTAMSAAILHQVHGTRRASNIRRDFNVKLLDGDKQFLCDVGEKKENQKKNRFRNMIAYDHSRVILPTLNGEPDSDYYNANYMKDYHGGRVFIASQGPNTASVDDFWRMMWEENVANIVMLTNLTERGKVRCLQYWPDSLNKTTVFGNIHVNWTGAEMCADYEIREIELRSGDEIRTVKNWHFRTWPDMDTPEQPTGLIGFAKRVKAAQESSSAPLTVHCSAGVGRTGTFIALCTLMDVLQTEEAMDVHGYVAKMREDRIMMVQTSKQYSFLHHCLLEAYLAGDTTVPAKEISSFSISENQEKLKQQFQVLSKLDKIAKEHHTPTPEEAEKCRFPSIVPVEKRRPFLISQGKMSTGNYINACFTSCYSKCKAFLATQSPLPTTVEDFWRLVFDWTCPLIVMLNELNANDETCCQYWPESGTAVYGYMRVELKEERNLTLYHHRLFDLRHAHSQKVLTVHHVQLKSWNNENPTDVIRLIRCMEELQHENKMPHPTVVHCINGASRTGVFLTVASELSRMLTEHKLDVFNSVRQLRESNHNLVLTEEDYRLCHSILKADWPEPEYGNI